MVRKYRITKSKRIRKKGIDLLEKEKHTKKIDYKYIHERKSRTNIKYF